MHGLSIRSGAMIKTNHLLPERAVLCANCEHFGLFSSADLAQYDSDFVFFFRSDCEGGHVFSRRATIGVAL